MLLSHTSRSSKRPTDHNVTIGFNKYRHPSVLTVFIVLNAICPSSIAAPILYSANQRPPWPVHAYLNTEADDSGLSGCGFARNADEFLSFVLAFPIAAMAPVDFSGKWKLDRSENFDDYLKVMSKWGKWLYFIHRYHENLSHLYVAPCRGCQRDQILCHSVPVNCGHD